MGLKVVAEVHRVSHPITQGGVGGSHFIELVHVNVDLKEVVDPVEPNGMPKCVEHDAEENVDDPTDYDAADTYTTPRGLVHLSNIIPIL